MLDWAYITNEQRWVRRNASTWIYASAPAAFNSRYRTQNAAQNGGLVTVGRFIFDRNKHAMRIIRAYNGAVPGPPTYAWHAFQGGSADVVALTQAAYDALATPDPYRPRTQERHCT